MGLFDLFTSAKATLNKTFNPDYGKNMDFLEAVCAAAALVASADGDLAPSEKDATITLLSTHKDLSRIYPSSEIKKQVNTFFERANSSSGRASLAGELRDIKGNKAMCNDVYYIAVDIAAAAGGTDAKEEAMLVRIANEMGVDPQPSW